MNMKAFFTLSYGVYIVSANCNGKMGGCVINTLAQVTSSPARLSIAINHDNETSSLIEESGSFSAVVLGEDVYMELIKTFGFNSSRYIDKFDRIAYECDRLGNPYPIHGTAARFSCKIVDKLDLGTHVIFIGEVVESELMEETKVLTYADYHNKKKGSTPKNAPSYQESAQRGYRCSVCGYVYDGDELPDDLICPVCGRDVSHFERIG